jgi:predicted Holliday junction resolvase-like endonuclease
VTLVEISLIVVVLLLTVSLVVGLVSKNELLGQIKSLQQQIEADAAEVHRDLKANLRARQSVARTYSSDAKPPEVDAPRRPAKQRDTRGFVEPPVEEDWRHQL